MDYNFSDSIHAVKERKIAPFSLCIVSNQLNMNLEEIIRISDGLAGEILIGYDGDLKEIPSSFRTQPHARIVPLKWEGYSITKNKLASEAKHDWILSLDGDEIPDEELLLQITSLPFESLPIHQTYALKRVSFFKGKKITHGAWGRDRVLRLYNKRYTQWNGAVVHEDLQKKTDTTVLLLKGELRHYTAEDYE